MRQYVDVVNEDLILTFDEVCKDYVLSDDEVSQLDSVAMDQQVVLHNGIVLVRIE
jgi:hypothetical protein